MLDNEIIIRVRENYHSIVVGTMSSSSLFVPTQAQTTLFYEFLVDKNFLTPRFSFYNIIIRQLHDAKFRANYLEF